MSQISLNEVIISYQMKVGRKVYPLELVPYILEYRKEGEI